MDPLQRCDLIEKYRETRCDILVDGVWSSFKTVPATPLFLVSAWNPGGVPATAHDNARHDEELRTQLAGAGFVPQRIRGRSGSEVEEGWLIPFERTFSLQVLTRFRQAAGIIWGIHGRSLLWADGRISPIDTDRCEIPDVDAV